MVWGLIMRQKQHGMSMICIRPFFDQPARPTKIGQKWKFLTSVFFVQFGWNLGCGMIMGQQKHRKSLICLQPFFDLPARPTKIDQKWKFLTSVFFIRFGWNLVWGLIMGQKQHRMSLTKVNISNLCVFCPIWIKFSIWANNGPTLT